MCEDRYYSGLMVISEGVILNHHLTIKWVVSEGVILTPFDYPYLFHLEKYPSSIAPGFNRGISKGALSGL